MGAFFAELKRRHIYRVAAAYAVIAWLLIQLVNNLAPMLRLPEWAGSFFFVALLIGFPIALIFAWIHDLAPGEGALGRVTTGRLDWALIGALSIVILLMSYQVLMPSRATVTADGVDQQRSAADNPATAVSVVVLPFQNLSGDATQEFFSDGITEEITSALTKIPDLRVVARESAFQYKGERNDVRTVGQALGATHVIGGSVRKEGDRVRITAQLAEAGGGVNIWSETYDRQLASVFATQEDIATSIAGALRMPLGLRPGQQLVSSRNIDQESYAQYLRAKALHRQRIGGGGLRGLNEAAAILEQVVAKNPNYAPAWSSLADVYDTTPNYSGIVGRNSVTMDQMRAEVQASQTKAEAAARKAIEVDPDLAQGYRTLGEIRARAGKPLEGFELLVKALALDPSDAELLSSQAHFLAQVGKVREALQVAQQAQQLEPFIPIVNRDLAVALWLNGQDEQAIQILRQVAGGNSNVIAIIQAAAGRYSEAADALMGAPPAAGYSPDEVAEAVRLLRLAPAKIPSPENAKRLGLYDFVYLYVGAPEQALRHYETTAEAGWVNFRNRLLSHPSYGPARQTERYKALARKLGLVEFWRVKGWPDFCRPTTGDDFECS
jgi:TolB-like protein/Flp pilus assembly protein TadD